MIGYTSQAVHVGPMYPNATTDWSDQSPKNIGYCADTPETLQFPKYDHKTGMYNGACLYNVFSDPSEYNNLNPKVQGIFNPDPTIKAILQRLSLRLYQINQTTWYNDRGVLNDLACQVSVSSWNGTIGPFIQNSIPFVDWSTSASVVAPTKKPVYRYPSKE